MVCISLQLGQVSRGGGSSWPVNRLCLLHIFVASLGPSSRNILSPLTIGSSLCGAFFVSGCALFAACPSSFSFWAVGVALLRLSSCAWNRRFVRVDCSSSCVFLLGSGDLGPFSVAADWPPAHAQDVKTRTPSLRAATTRPRSFGIVTCDSLRRGSAPYRR
jgi:hypothetical protein